MKMFEPSQSLWWSRKQEPPCVPVQEQCCSLGTGREMLSGVATETSGCSPSSFGFAWTESSARHWELAAPAPGRAVMGCGWGFPTVNLLLTQPASPISPPEYRHNHTSLFPSSSFSALTKHTKVTPHHHFHPGSLWPRCCDSFSVCLNVLVRAIPWKQRYFTDVP